ncbi:16630_t:CDS:2 [Funneliformis caledonium]|uniref:16630_t:CDS:1 n=1 Tax=Funneliformis caledonium TaxID=1117310 RepID=A0A9N8ZLY7_9GLOM|nr:16630_t:CDS:2 [Funneliformis caledonium]
MHPLTILEDISYKLRVSSPRYKFNQTGNPGEITCTLTFLNKSWSSPPALTTMQGAKEDVARLAFKDLMENMEPNLRERLVKSLKVQKNKYMNTNPQKKRLQKNHPKEKSQRKVTSKESIQPKDQNQNQRSKKNFIGNKPRSFGWLNHQASKGRQNPNINLKCPCHMLKEFCKFQKLGEPVYDTKKIFDAFIGKVSIGDFQQEADCVARYEICIRERASELAFNYLFNQSYEKEYLELNRERKEVFKPWNNGVEEGTAAYEEGWSDDDEELNLSPQYIDYAISRFQCPYEQQIYPSYLYYPTIYRPQVVYGVRPYKTYPTLLSEMFCAKGGEKIKYEFEKLGGGWYCSIIIKNHAFRSEHCERKKDAKDSAAKKAYLAFCNPQYIT